MQPSYPHRSPRPRHPRPTAALLAVDRAVYGVTRHWLFMVNGMLVAWLILAALAPILRANGGDLWASLIYALNRPFCHQRAERSFNLFGEKMACCQRCTAIYGGLIVFGGAYVAFRGLRPLAGRWVGLLAVPILLDGLTQTVGLRESTWELRVVSGGLFAIGFAWLALPHLETGFAEMRLHLERRFARLVVDGRARPRRGAPPVPSS